MNRLSVDMAFNYLGDSATTGVSYSLRKKDQVVILHRREWDGYDHPYHDDIGYLPKYDAFDLMEKIAQFNKGKVYTYEKYYLALDDKLKGEYSRYVKKSCHVSNNRRFKCNVDDKRVEFEVKDKKSGDGSYFKYFELYHSTFNDANNLARLIIDIVDKVEEETRKDLLENLIDQMKKEMPNDKAN